MDLFNLEEAEIVRISKSEYDTMVANAKKIQEYTDDANEAKTVMKFTDRNNFPTVEEMKQHDVIHNLRRYLPSIIIRRKYLLLMLKNRNEAKNISTKFYRSSLRL